MTRTSWLRRRAPSFQPRGLQQLRRSGVWLSAPSGNDEFLMNRTAWPAREPLLSASVGCAKGQRPILHRSARTTLLAPASQGLYTSACNTNVCSVAVAVRSYLHRACAVPPSCVHASLILDLMIETSIQSDWDLLTRRRYPILDVPRLFHHLSNRTSSADDDGHHYGATSGTHGGTACGRGTASGREEGMEESASGHASSGSSCLCIKLRHGCDRTST